MGLVTDIYYCNIYAGHHYQNASVAGLRLGFSAARTTLWKELMAVKIAKRFLHCDGL